MRISKIVGCSLLSVAVAMLAACGGGGGGDSGTKVVNTPIPTIVVVPYSRFSTSSKVSASVDTSVSPTQAIFVDTGQVDDAFPPMGWLPFPAITMAAYGTATPSFVGYQGVIKADSKAFAVCSQNAQANASQVNTVNYPFQKGLEVFLSGATKVTSFAEVNGMTFKEFDCAGVIASKTFNADNTITSNAMQGVNILSTALFLTQNVTEEGSTKTGSLFKISTTAGIKYFLVTSVTSPVGRYFTFSYQP